MLCDMSQGEILVDGELFYRNGRFGIGGGGIAMTRFPEEGISAREPQWEGI
jgi:hypothetical protein